MSRLIICGRWKAVAAAPAASASAAATAAAATAAAATAAAATAAATAAAATAATARNLVETAVRASPEVPRTLGIRCCCPLSAAFAAPTAGVGSSYGGLRLHRSISSSSCCCCSTQGAWRRGLTVAAARPPQATEASFGDDDEETAAAAAAAAAAKAVDDDPSLLVLRCRDHPSFNLLAAPSVVSRLQHVRERREAAGGAAGTQAAAAAAADAAAAAAASCIGLRVTVAGGGCSGYKYSFAVVAFQEAKANGDL